MTLTKVALQVLVGAAAVVVFLYQWNQYERLESELVELKGSIGRQISFVLDCIYRVRQRIFTALGKIYYRV